MAQGVQPATASQRLGLSAAGAGGQITQVPGPEFYTMEWTSNGPRSNLESGLVPGGRSVPDPLAAVESISWEQDESKISIWDCRRAIEIAGGIPLTIRGDLFVGSGPHPVARWISETVLITQLESNRVDGHREYRVYALRAGTPHQAGARHHCGRRSLICRATIGLRPLEAPENTNRPRPTRVRVGSQTRSS